MDEPTNGIDPEGMHELMALIRELAEKDEKTILISSHQLHQIQADLRPRGHLCARQVGGLRRD